MHGTSDLSRRLVIGVCQIPKDWRKPILKFMQGHLPLQIPREVFLNLLLSF